MQTATAELRQALDKLVEVDPIALGEREAIVALHREHERLTAIVTRATAAFDASGDWEADGARSAPAWICTERRLPMATAKRRVWLGRCLRDMAAVEQAWLDGDIGDAHAALLAKAQHRAPGAFARDEAMLVGYANEHRYRFFARLVAYWLQAADSDGDEAEAAKQLAARRFHLSQSFEGMWFCEGVFDPISGEIVANALRRIEDELFEKDWAEAKARVGDEQVRIADLGRSPPSAEPMRWWRWPGVPRRCPPVLACPHRWYRSWSTIPAPPGASLSWRREPWSARGRCCAG